MRLHSVDTIHRYTLDRPLSSRVPLHDRRSPDLKPVHRSDIFELRRRSTAQQAGSVHECLSLTGPCQAGQQPDTDRSEPCLFFPGLPAHLGTRTRNTVGMAGVAKAFELLTMSTTVQRQCWRRSPGTCRSCGPHQFGETPVGR